jgi:hypothetical protein
MEDAKALGHVFTKHFDKSAHLTQSMNTHGPCHILDTGPSCIYSINSVSYLKREEEIVMQSEHELSAILMYLPLFGKYFKWLATIDPF